MAKKETKSDKIRALLAQGLKQADIVRKLGVSSQLVYAVARSSGYSKPRKAKAAKQPRMKVRLSREQDLMLKVMLLLNDYQKAA